VQTKKIRICRRNPYDSCRFYSGEKCQKCASNFRVPECRRRIKSL